MIIFKKKEQKHSFKKKKNSYIKNARSETNVSLHSFFL